MFFLSFFQKGQEFLEFLLKIDYQKVLVQVLVHYEGRILDNYDVKGILVT
jgi:hypothetical protein